MSSYTIRLDHAPEIEDTTDFAVVDGWWIDDNVVTVVSNSGKTRARYKLPRGKARVTLSRIGSGRAQLALGGYTTTTVSVVGPIETLEALREAVL